MFYDSEENDVTEDSL